MPFCAIDEARREAAEVLNLEKKFDKRKHHFLDSKQSSTLYNSHWRVRFLVVCSSIIRRKKSSGMLIYQVFFVLLRVN